MLSPKKIFHKNIINFVPSKNIILKFDGCSKGNPGPAACGAVIYKNGEEFWSHYKYVGKKETNNVAEYCGLLLGLQACIDLDIKDIIVMGDSMLVIKQMKGQYKVRSDNLLQYYNESKSKEKLFDSITYKHIYRTENIRADELANLGLKNEESIFKQSYV
jgi:ribonuclease HI